MRRKAAAGRLANADKENKESGNFALWMERGERGTRERPGTFARCTPRGTTQPASGGTTCTGGDTSTCSAAPRPPRPGSDARADRYRTTASEVSATAEEVRWEEENSRASEGSGLSDMASMRDAIKSASRSTSERTTRSRSHLSSHVGII